MTAKQKLNEGKMQVHPVRLTLEEVYHGCLKKVIFQRRKLLPDQSIETEDRQLVIDVKPGLPDGTRFVFERFEPTVPKVSYNERKKHVHAVWAPHLRVVITCTHN